MNQGAGWLKSSLKVQLSPLGERVAELLDDVFSGIYHIREAVEKADWCHPDYIELKLGQTMATWDFRLLTRLVFAAHHYAIRVEVSPYSRHNLMIVFHGRARSGTKTWEYHPTLEKAVADWNDDHATPREAKS